MSFLFSLKTPIKPLPHYLSTRLLSSSRFNNSPTSMVIPPPPSAKFVAAVDSEVGLAKRSWIKFHRESVLAPRMERMAATIARRWRCCEALISLRSVGYWFFFFFSWFFGFIMGVGQWVFGLIDLFFGFYGFQLVGFDLDRLVFSSSYGWVVLGS